MKLRICAPLLLSLALVACAGQMSEPVSTQAPPAPPAAPAADDRLPLTLFYDLLEPGPKARAALIRIESDWDDAYASMLLDLIYFSTAPEIDAAMTELLGKAKVLALRVGDEPLAIAADYIARHPVHHDRLAETDFVVLTNPSGANRVFETRGLRFTRWDGTDSARDVGGEVWRVSERALESAPGSACRGCLRIAPSGSVGMRSFRERVW
jgi:hypothetical protein